MIAFVTLLLGLISGNYPIEVTVGGPVAAVEYRLDGATVARLEGPPWSARVDLGPDLRPRELVVVALDAQGGEVARVSQWLNLPRPAAEVEVVLEKGPDGVPAAARLTWQSVNGVAPMAVDLTLDGQPLAIDAQGRAPLPAVDLKVLHVISAELSFPPAVIARRDVAFGGEYGGEVSTELTAVPLRLARGASLPAPPALAGWLAAGGEPVSVAAVEDGPGKAIFVRVPTARQLGERLLPRRQRGDVLPDLRSLMRLGPEDRLRFLSLSTQAFHDSRVPAALFQPSEELGGGKDGVLWYLARTSMPGDGAREGLRISDAVAVAGLTAAAENHRRAVVLLLDGNPVDASRYDPVTVRRYLESVRVPLHVWSLDGDRSAAAKAWGGAGKVEDVSTVAALARAVTRLREDLGSQRIVWIEGRRLPQTVALTPAAQGVELAGAAPAGP